MNNKQQLVNWVMVTLREAAWAPLAIICFYAIGLNGGSGFILVI